MRNSSLPKHAPDAPLTVALVGVGEFGASFLFRSGRTANFRVVAAADGDVQRVIDAALVAGHHADRIAQCTSTAEAHAAQRRGDFVAVADASLLMDLPLDFVVEATGVPEAAARIAAMAIAHGKNVGMVTKECDSVVGPILQTKAAAAGLVCTSVDGDQPSLAMGLVAWSRMLGLEVVCAGKASEYDFVYDPEQESITALGRTAVIPGMRGLWNVPPAALARCIDERRERLTAWPHRTAPDLCELSLIANATGLKPDIPGLHAPVARTLELPELMRPRAEGGLFNGVGVLDIFNCLRRADEISFAGGVFVVVRCDDRATWRVLRGKGIPVSADGACALLHNPVHLLGIEAPMTLLASAVSGQPSGILKPRCDLVARATISLTKGTRLALGERHTMAGVDPLLIDAQPAQSGAPVPYYMAAGCVLAADVPSGAMLCRKHLQPPVDSVLWALREEQDAKFFG